MGNILWYGVTFIILCNYNLLQQDFVCGFQCTVIGLLLSDKGGTWFIEFTFDVFDPSIQSDIFFSSLHIAYMRGCWTFPCLFECIDKVGAVFDAQGLSLFFATFIPEYADWRPFMISVSLTFNNTCVNWRCIWVSCRPL